MDGTSSSTPALRFLLIGDWGGQPKDRMAQKRVAQQMGRTAARFPEPTTPVIALGDNFYRRGVQSSDDELFKLAFEEVYDAPALQNRWHVVAGNRDHKGNVGAQLAYTQLSQRWYFPALYYTETFTLPGTRISVQFVFFDSMIYLGKNPQEQDCWLETTLKESRADWVFVVAHHPVLSVGEHGPTERLQKHLKPLLEEHRVAAYFSGHDHNLQHLQESGSLVDYFLCGTGYETCALRDNDHKVPEGALKFFWPPAQVAQGAFMTLEVVDEKSMIATFIHENGDTLYTTTKRNPRHLVCSPA